MPYRFNAGAEFFNESFQIPNAVTAPLGVCRYGSHMGSDASSLAGNTVTDPSPVMVQGVLYQKELRQITRKVRSSILGPTSVYYAGVTAPAIAAGMANVAASALGKLDWTPYWVFLMSAIIASMAGISWYLIFMRLSYRHATGRSSEVVAEMHIEVDPLGIFWQRGYARGRIDWHGIEYIRVFKKFIHIRAYDTADTFILLSWFEDRKSMLAFAEQLKVFHQSALAETPSD